MRVVSALPVQALDREIVLNISNNTLYTYDFTAKTWTALGEGQLWAAYVSNGLVNHGGHLFERLPGDVRHVSYEPEQHSLPYAVQRAGTLIEVKGECRFVVSNGTEWVNV